MAEREINDGLGVRSAGSSVGEIEWIERDREAGARSRVAVVVEATPSSLTVNIPDWSKREGTGTGRREREPESEREEKRKNEERGERNGNIK